MNSINYSAPSHFGCPLSREIINNATLPDFTGRFRPRLSLSSEINEFQHTLLSPTVPARNPLSARHRAETYLFDIGARPFVLFAYVPLPDCTLFRVRLQGIAVLIIKPGTVYLGLIEI